MKLTPGEKLIKELFMCKYRDNGYKPINLDQSMGANYRQVIPIECSGKMNPPPKFKFKQPWKISFIDGGKICFNENTSEIILEPL